MVGSDEMQGQSKATVTTDRAQQILQAYNAYKASGGQPAPVKPSTQAPQSFPSSSPQINISQKELQKTNALRAEQDLPPLQEVSNVKVVEPTRTTYTQSQPAPEKITSPTRSPDTGVLTGRSGQIQKTHDTINQITTDFQAAKDAGVTSIQVKDSNGNVIGTVNPQNVAMARLQYLNLTKKGAVQYQYQTTSTQGQAGVTSTLTTYKPMNVLTAFTGGALGGFAELGLIGLGLVAKATGKPITIPGTNYTAQPKGVVEQAQEKVQKTFGRETLDKMISGEKVDLSNPLELASLTGFGAAVIATGGLGGARAVLQKGGTTLLSLLREESPTIAKAESKDIGLNIKASEAYQKALLFEKQASRLPPPATVKTATIPTFTSSEINLGKGLGREIGKGGGGETTGLFRSSGGSTGGGSFGEKTVTVGKGGLTQIVREKVKLEKPQTVQKQEPLVKQKQDVLLKQKQEQIVKERQAQKQIRKPKIRQEQKQEELLLVRPVSRTSGTKTTQVQKQKSMTGLVSKQTQKIKSAPIAVTTHITKQTQKQTNIPDQLKTNGNTTNIPDTKKTPPGFPGLLGGGAKPGALGRVGKGGNRLGYIGNVPLTNIVGVYKRSEITYGNRAEKVARSGSKQNFSRLGTKKSRKLL